LGDRKHNIADENMISNSCLQQMYYAFHMTTKKGQDILFKKGQI